MQPWAAIFDWDGVIIDSSRQHSEAWQRLAGETGRTLPDGFFLKSFGMKNESAIRTLLGWTDDPTALQGLSFRKEELYRELIHQQGLAPLPGVTACLAQLRAAAVPCAIGSSTPRLNIECVLEHLALGSPFDAVVSADDVTHGKPDPEVFLLAARKLNVPPARCVVFEDAPVGIQAARAAGMKVVGLATTHPAETLRETDLVVHRLDELDLDSIRRWFNARAENPQAHASKIGLRCEPG